MVTKYFTFPPFASSLSGPSRGAALRKTGAALVLRPHGLVSRAATHPRRPRTMPWTIPSRNAGHHPSRGSWVADACRESRPHAVTPPLRGRERRSDSSGSSAGHARSVRLQGGNAKPLELSRQLGLEREIREQVQRKALSVLRPR